MLFHELGYAQDASQANAAAEWTNMTNANPGFTQSDYQSMGQGSQWALRTEGFTNAMGLGLSKMARSSGYYMAGDIVGTVTPR